jgi:hypothetical protein
MASPAPRSGHAHTHSQLTQHWLSPPCPPPPLPALPHPTKVALAHPRPRLSPCERLDQQVLERGGVLEARGGARSENVARGGQRGVELAQQAPLLGGRAVAAEPRREPGGVRRGGRPSERRVTVLGRGVDAPCGARGSCGGGGRGGGCGGLRRARVRAASHRGKLGSCGLKVSRGPDAYAAGSSVLVTACEGMRLQFMPRRMQRSTTSASEIESAERTTARRRLVTSAGGARAVRGSASVALRACDVWRTRAAAS